MYLYPGCFHCVHAGAESGDEHAIRVSQGSQAACVLQDGAICGTVVCSAWHRAQQIHSVQGHDCGSRHLSESKLMLLYLLNMPTTHARQHCFFM